MSPINENYFDNEMMDLEVESSVTNFKFITNEPDPIIVCLRPKALQ